MFKRKQATASSEDEVVVFTTREIEYLMELAGNAPLLTSGTPTADRVNAAILKARSLQYTKSDGTEWLSRFSILWED